jgi:hypothetical protein
VITALLREPDSILERCRTPSCQPEVARNALALLIVGAALFGAAVGSYRGGTQIALGALKLPLATLLTLSVCGPAFAALAAAFDRAWGLRATLAIVLAAGARFALVLGALSPPLWLAIDLGAPYHLTKIVASLAYGLAGLSALALLLRALGDGAGRAGAAIAFLAVYAVVGAQAAWLFRPYIGDPRDGDVPLLVLERKEGGVLRALQEAL